MAGKALFEDRVVLNVYLSKMDKEKFDEMARLEGVSGSHKARELIKKYINKNERWTPPF